MDDLLGWLSFAPLVITLAFILSLIVKYRKQLIKELNE